MIKFGYVMLAVNLLLALVAWFMGGEDAHDHTLMFMCGAALWIVGLLVWYKVLGQEQEE